MHTVDGGPRPGPPSAFYPPPRPWCPARWTTIGTSPLGTSSTLLQRDILEAQLLRGDLPKRTLSMVSHPLDHHRHFTPLFAHGVPPPGPPSALGRHLGQHPGQHSASTPVGTPVSTAQRRGSSAAKNLQKSFRFLDKSAIFVLVDGPASTDSELFVRFVFWRFVWNSGLSLQII